MVLHLSFRVKVFKGRKVHGEYDIRVEHVSLSIFYSFHLADVYSMAIYEQYMHAQQKMKIRRVHSSYSVSVRVKEWSVFHYPHRKVNLSSVIFSLSRVEFTCRSIVLFWNYSNEDVNVWAAAIKGVSL